MRRVSDTMSPLRKRPHSRVVLERHLWSYSRGTTCRRTIRQRTPLASGRAHSKPTSVGWSRHQSGHRSRADSVVCALGLDGVAEGDCAGYKRDEPGAEPRLAVPAPVTRQSPDRLLAAGKCDRVNRGHDAAVAHHSRAELQVSDPRGRPGTFGEWLLAVDDDVGSEPHNVQSLAGSGAGQAPRCSLWPHLALWAF